MAASQVDYFLEKALKEIAPKGISKNKLDNIFDFTGPLGTFSSRLNIALYLRIINDQVFQAINALRGLRNDVAHKPKTFSLSDKQDSIDKLYNLGVGVPETLHSCAIKGVLKAAIDHALTIEIDDDRAFTDVREVVRFIQENPGIKRSMEEILPKWKLGLGIALICGIIFYGSNKVSHIFNNSSKV